MACMYVIWNAHVHMECNNEENSFTKQWLYCNTCLKLVQETTSLLILCLCMRYIWNEKQQSTTTKIQKQPVFSANILIMRCHMPPDWCISQDNRYSVDISISFFTDHFQYVMFVCISKANMQIDKQNELCFLSTIWKFNNSSGFARITFAKDLFISKYWRHVTLLSSPTKCMVQCLLAFWSSFEYTFLFVFTYRLYLWKCKWTDFALYIFTLKTSE